MKATTDRQTELVGQWEARLSEAEARVGRLTHELEAARTASADQQQLGEQLRQLEANAEELKARLLAKEQKFAELSSQAERLASDKKHDESLLTELDLAAKASAKLIQALEHDKAG